MKRQTFDATGYLYCSDHTSGNIVKYPPDGTQSIFASGLNSPAGLAFDSVGNLYEADQGSGNLYKFTPDGARSPFATGLSNPTGVAFTPNSP